MQAVWWQMAGTGLTISLAIFARYSLDFLEFS
jgi:hypothetical protein